MAAIATGAVATVIVAMNKQVQTFANEVINELRRRGHDVPVLAISGGGTFPKQSLLTSAKLLGAVATIEKPFDLDELSRVVEATLKPGPDATT